MKRKSVLWLTGTLVLAMSLSAVSPVYAEEAVVSEAEEADASVTKEAVTNEAGEAGTSDLGGLVDAILDTGNPVLAWYVSQPMRDIMYRWSWLDENNETVSWPGGEHAVVICGYDDHSLTYRDPNAGTTVVIDFETFEKSFQELGGRIVYYTH